MAALIHPNRTHGHPLGPVTAAKSSPVSRPEVGPPPRSGSVARSRAGQRGRANLRLVSSDQSNGSGVVVNLEPVGVNASGEGIGVRLHDLMATPVQELWPTMSLARGVNYTLGMVLAIALAPILGLGILWSIGAAVDGDVSTSSENVSAQEFTTVVVSQGDTLWSVAAEVAPNVERRAAVWAIRQANGGQTDLKVGQHLVIPASLEGK